MMKFKDRDLALYDVFLGMFLIIVFLFNLANIMYNFFQNKTSDSLDIAISFILLGLIILSWVMGERYNKYAFLIINLILIISVVGLLRQYNSIEYPNNIGLEYGDPGWAPRTIPEEIEIAFYNFQKGFTISLVVPFVLCLVYFWVNVKSFMYKL